MVDPPVKDFGMLRPQIIQCTYTITNPLPFDVVLTGVMKSCTCTSASLDRDRLAPGQSATLKCEFDLRGRAGPFAATMSVVYRGDGNNSKPDAVQCGARADVDPVVHVAPIRLEFLKGVGARRVVAVKMTEPGFRVHSVWTNHKAFTSSLSAAGDQVYVDFHPESWASSERSATMWIGTDHPFEREIAVPLAVSESDR